MRKKSYYKHEYEMQWLGEYRARGGRGFESRLPQIM